MFETPKAFRLFLLQLNMSIQICKISEMSNKNIIQVNFHTSIPPQIPFSGVSFLKTNFKNIWQKNHY